MTHLTTRTTTRPRRHVVATTVLAGFVAALAVFAWAGPASAATNLVADPDFASPSLASSYSTYCSPTVTGCLTSGSTFGSWTVTSGSIDLYSNSFFAPPAGDPASTQSVDLDGSSPGGISQSVSLTPGTYQFSFQVSQNIPGCNTAAVKSVTYGLGSNPAGTFAYDPAVDTGWVPVSFFVSVNNSANYSFFLNSADASGDCGPVVTDLSLTAVPVAGAPLANPVVAAAGAGVIGVLGVTVLAYLAIRRRRGAGSI